MRIRPRSNLHVVAVGDPTTDNPGPPRPGSHHPQKESTKCNAEAKHGATATHAAPPSVLCTGSAPPPAHAAVSQASRPPAVQRYLHSWPCLPCHVVADQDKAVPLYRSITGRMCCELRFGPMGRLRQDRGSCAFGCCT